MNERCCDGRGRYTGPVNPFAAPEPPRPIPPLPAPYATSWKVNGLAVEVRAWTALEWEALETHPAYYQRTPSGLFVSVAMA